MPSFSPIPDIPTAGLPQWESAVLTAIKNNLDLLTGMNGGTRAVTNDSVGLQQVSMLLKQVTALGAGYTVSGVNVPQLADYGNLINDVTTLANDLYNTQATLNALIQQLEK